MEDKQNNFWSTELVRWIHFPVVAFVERKNYTTSLHQFKGDGDMSKRISLALIAAGRLPGPSRGGGC